MRRLLAALALGAGVSLAPAHAEIWGFVDGQGVAHFAAERVDERYELFFRGGENFDTASGVATPHSEPVPERVPVPVPTPAPAGSASKLVAFFEVSPGYKIARRHLAEAAREQGIELELLQALVATESGFDPAAVSPKGAIGLMQIMPATAERYGVSGEPRLPLARKLSDPRTNVRTGARYLRDLIRMFPGRIELALAAYNAGEGAVQRAGNRIPNFPETQNYVRTVMQLYTVLKPPAAPASPAPAPAQSPRRVRMELPGPVARRNIPAGLAAVAPLEEAGEPAAVAAHE